MAAVKRVVVVAMATSNLTSIVKALEVVGGDVTVSLEAQDLRDATHLVIPGVGAFRPAISWLNREGLSSQLSREVKAGKPLLGVCLGMQLMADEGDEGGSTAGLGWIDGRVESLRREKVTRIRVPNVGWLDVDHQNDRLFTQVPQSSSFYFSHSFELLPTFPRDVVATVTVGTRSVVAAIRKGSLIGTQFHPEKSGTSGLRLLQNFLRE